MPNDRIVLDVGGSKFVTSKKTLSAWTNAFDVGEKQDTLFLDSDPDAFAILLSFMRNGSIESSRVTDEVLKQAIHYQVEGFVSFVRTMDRIVLNLRGTHVETSKKLLVESSSFFREKFSDSWELKCNPFLNQDPVAFSVLLEFMTRGHVEQSKLSSEVLELAEFLGIETLIDAVKTKLCWAGNDEKSIVKFNDEYGSLLNAVKTYGGSLFKQQELMAASSARLEYASVYLHKKRTAASPRMSLRLPFRACVYGNVSPELLRMGDTINVLNRLGKEGFALAPASLQQSWRNEKNIEDVPGLGRVLSHVLFVKQDTVDLAGRRESVQSRILSDDNNDEGSIGIVPREFVALLRPADELLASNVVKLVVPSSDSAPAYWAGTQLRDPPDPSFHGAIAWLTNHGFHHQEPILSEAFNSALADVDAMGDKGAWSTVLVFSKRIPSTRDNRERVDVSQPESLPTIIEPASTASSVTDASLENGH